MTMFCRSEIILRKGYGLNTSCSWDGLCVKVAPASLAHSVLVTSPGLLSVTVTQHIRGRLLYKSKKDHSVLQSRGSSTRKYPY